MFQKLKTIALKSLYVILAILLTSLLFISGVLYVNISDMSITFGIDLLQERTETPEETILRTEKALRGADILLEDARQRGYLE